MVDTRIHVHTYLAWRIMCILPVLCTHTSVLTVSLLLSLRLCHKRWGKVTAYSTDFPVSCNVPTVPVSVV